MINSSLSDDMKEITYHGSVNLGVAVDTPRGLPSTPSPVAPDGLSSPTVGLGGSAARWSPSR
ncbi:2-oxo acid dehydrogenase subunit E2 [Nakamurella deserti]|uniref:2-oxo acid dehydrogenase subunit E2 n=1 Tax=Nakamurella deserti TaxID=2164074 RepID=UPI001F0CA6C0|nr:2-oxo acid dehydrogenase subunit E2 [Nakamurella deserti]